MQKVVIPDSTLSQGEYMQWKLKEESSNDNFIIYIFRAVPRILCLRGQTPHTFTGVFRIQTGFLVGHFVFTPTQKVSSKTFKETNHTDTFCLIVMIYYGINTLFSLKLPPRSLLHNDDLHTIFNSSYTVNSSLTLCMDGFKSLPLLV